MHYLIMVMKVVVGDCNKVTGMSDIHLSVIVVEAMICITIKLIVINPDVFCFLDCDRIVAFDLANNQVSDNYVRFADNLQASTVNDAGRAYTKDCSIAT
jgi:hypothetical protein